MAIKYRAYAGEREITDFFIGEKETNQIWGGNTLLWEKGKNVIRHFYVGTGSQLQYGLPPNAIYLSKKMYSLYSELTSIPLTKSNIEFGSYIEESFANNSYTANSFFLCKAKTEEVKKNIKNFVFYKYEYSGRTADEPVPMPPNVRPELYVKLPTKIVLSDNVFSVSDYSPTYNSDGINMFQNHPYITSYVGPITTAYIEAGSGDKTGIPLLRNFSTRQALMEWALQP